MIDKYLLDEIIKLPSENTTTLFTSLSILKNFNIELMNNNQYNIYYRVKVEDILKSDIDLEKLIEVHNCGWVYDEKEEYLIKFL